MTRSIYEIEKGPADYDADRTWLEEVRRRSAEFDGGFVRAIPADEVFARALARLSTKVTFPD